MTGLIKWIAEESVDNWIPKYDRGHFTIDSLILMDVGSLTSVKEFGDAVLERAKKFNVDVSVENDPISKKVTVFWRPKKDA